MAETTGVDPEPLVFWQAAPLQVIPDADAGQVVIEVNYRVAPDNEAAFVEAMADSEATVLLAPHGERIELS